MSEVEELNDLYETLKSCIEKMNANSADFNLNLVRNNNKTL